MERLVQCETFKLFEDLELKQVKYSTNHTILVAVWKNGTIGIFSVERHHQPTKMMHLEFPPTNVHIAFSQVFRKIHVTKQASQSYSKVIDDSQQQFERDDDDEDDQYAAGQENIDESNIQESQMSVEESQMQHDNK